jgi:hypothetical protein
MPESIAEQAVYRSQHSPISINNNGECWESPLSTDTQSNFDQGDSSSVTPEPVDILTESALREEEGQNGQKQVQPHTGNAIQRSQHLPISINNNGESWESPSPTIPPDNSLGQIPAPTDPVTNKETEDVYYPHLDKLSPQERGKLEEFAGRLEQASQGQAQNLETLLGKATDYLIAIFNRMKHNSNSE